MRVALLVSMATVGCTWGAASAASALELGPVSVPVTLPTVGPVSVEAPAVAPQLGVKATVSPATGVAISVTTPSAIGPVPLAGVSHSVHIAIGAGGASVAVAPTGAEPQAAAALAPAPPPASTAGENRVPRASSLQSPVARPAAAASSAAVSHAAANHPANALARGNTSGVVNASLRHAAPGGVWDLRRGGASARVLWLALLLIALAANWVVGGFIRDALRRPRAVNPV